MKKSLSTSTPHPKPHKSLNKPLRKLPILPGRRPNFLRVGCPTHSLIHIPHSVAVLNKYSTVDLAKSKLSINDLINKKATERVQVPKKSIQKVWDLFDSIIVPIQSFSQIKVPSRWFSLDSNIYSAEEEHDLKIILKGRHKDLLKPLSQSGEIIMRNLKNKLDFQ